MFETHASIVISTLHIVKDFQWHEGITLPILLSHCLTQTLILKPRG